MNRFIKYWISGGIYFWSGYITFAICYGYFHIFWLWSKIIADIFGWTLNYYFQRFWTFKDVIHLKEMEHLKRYLIIEIVGFILDYLIIFELKNIGITPYIGFFISSIFFTFWSYAWYKYWVFPAKKKNQKS